MGLLAACGFKKFTNYLLYNYNDTPKSLYERMRINFDLSHEHNVTITGFPMRYIPIYSTRRDHVSEHWPWRYLRGLQCVLRATYGIVSPNRQFFNMAFGRSYKEFCEIISMPDDYIMFRKSHASDGVLRWKKGFCTLSSSDKKEFLCLLETLNGSRTKQVDRSTYRKFGSLLRHYYAQNMIDVG